MMAAWKGKLVSKIEGTWPQDVVVSIYIPDLETFQRILHPCTMSSIFSLHAILVEYSVHVICLRSAAVFCHDRLQL